MAVLQLGQGDAGGGGQGDGLDPERVEVQFAGVIGAVGGEQARLEADKREGVIGAQGAAAHPAAIGVEAARHVERQFRAVQGAGLSDPARVIAADVALQPHAEQAVDDEAVALRRRDVRHDRAAAFTPGGPGARRIRRQARRVGPADGRHAASPGGKQARRDQGIAAVVAGAYQDQDGIPRFVAQHAGQFGSGSACALHQR